MLINIHNVEELIFMDRRVQALLPEFIHLFDSWALGTRATSLRNLARRAVLDLLGGLDAVHLGRLAAHFRDEVAVDRLDYHVVRNVDGDAGDLADRLCGLETYTDVALYRKGGRVYVSAWR